MMSILFILFLNTLNVSCFDLPGIKPHEYQFQERVPIKVNKLESVLINQLPFDYYNLPFCRPKSGVKKDAENLGESLTGDSIENSAYIVEMLLPTECVALCKKTYSKKELYAFASKIDAKYKVNLIVDNLPAAQKFKTISYGNNSEEIEDFIYKKGYPLGYSASSGGVKLIMLNNHIDLVILIHDNPRYEGNRIVGFKVQPRSISHNISSFNDLSCTSDALRIAGPSIPESLDVIWSYSVMFELSSIGRWDPYSSV